MYWLDITTKVCALILSIFGIIKIIEEVRNWKNKKQKSKAADLRIYKRKTEQAFDQLRIENVSDTASAEEVILYFDGINSKDHGASILDIADISSMPPHHAATITVVQSFQCYVKLVHVSWKDETGQHETKPIQLDAIPEY